MRPVFSFLLWFAGSVWTLPNTLLGLLVLGLLFPFGARAQFVRGVVEIHGPPVKRFLHLFFGGVVGVTLGQTVLSWTKATHAMARAHERVHVRQYLWFGPFFLPAYAFASLFIWVVGGDPYYSNPFEKQAYSIACLEPFPEEMP